MPTYDYECKECGYIHEEVQRITDKPLTDCPSCKEKNSLERLISRIGAIIFKGDGWTPKHYSK